MQLLVVGGTSQDQATYATPASDASYRVNLGAATPVWEQETMPFRRVMGDAVLLPDGTVFVTNGAQIGKLVVAVWHLSCLDMNGCSGRSWLKVEVNTWVLITNTLRPDGHLAAASVHVHAESDAAATSSQPAHWH